MAKRKFEYQDIVIIKEGYYKQLEAIFKGYNKDRQGYSTGYVTVDILINDDIYKTSISSQYLEKVK